MMNLNVGKKKPSKGKGFYIALALCICAVSLVAWNTFGDNLTATDTGYEVPETSAADDWDVSIVYPDVNEDTTPVQNILPNVVDDSTAVSVPIAEPPAVSETPPAKEDKKDREEEDEKQPLSQTMQPIVYTLPAGNTVIKPFSDKTPLYSVTFNDWRIHDGIDFKADIGSEVKAVADGEVTKIYKDDLWGNVVVIEHSGGLEVSYCGVGDTLLVREGMDITLGEVIGSVGKIPAEILDEPHLHLVIKVDGKPVEPLAALGKGSD